MKECKVVQCSQQRVVHNGRGIVAGESGGFCSSAKDTFWIIRNTGFP